MIQLHHPQKNYMLLINYCKCVVPRITLLPGLTCLSVKVFFPETKVYYRFLQDIWAQLKVPDQVMIEI